MKNNTGTPIGFEQEINIGDSNNIPVHYIDAGSKQQLITANEVLKLLDTYPKYQQLLKKTGGKSIAKNELDASQVEILNPLPYVELKEAQEELYEAFLMIEEIVKSFGLRIIDTVVPNQDFIPVHSGAQDRYQYIHDQLNSIGDHARKATNVVGTHITYAAGDDMHNHIAVSQYVRANLMAENYHALYADPTRIAQYNTVVSALHTLGFVKTGSLPQDINTESDVHTLQMDAQGEDLFSYELVRKKRSGKNDQLVHLSELRVVDGPVNAEEVLIKSEHALDVVNTALDHHQSSLYD